MDIGRRHTRTSSGWFQSGIFNAMLLLFPLLGANVVAGVFAAREFPITPRAAALDATRAEIHQQFTTLAAGSDHNRGTWASLVDLQLRERNMDAARGFLLAAPEMLDERDREAVEQAAPQAVPFGTKDEQIVGAALLFLPNDVRVRYETSNQPPRVVTASESSESGASPDAETDSEPTADILVAANPAPPTTQSTSFSVLGRFEDLVRQSQNWVAGETIDDGLELRVTALGLLADKLPDVGSADPANTASLLKAALRADRLQPAYRARLAYQVEQVLPNAALRTRLDTSLANVAPSAEQAAELEAAFEATLRPEALGPLMSDWQQITQIVNATSPRATLSLLDHVRSGSDLRRARLIAEASGDRAIALESIVGSTVLQTARTGIELSRGDVLEIMGLSATAMALFWMVLLGVQRHMVPTAQPLRYE